MRFAPWAVAGVLAVILGVSGTVYVVQADGDDHHSGMHGAGAGNMSGMMGGMGSMAMDWASMDEMHASMGELHDSMGGREAHDAMHGQMKAMMAEGDPAPGSP